MGRKSYGNTWWGKQWLNALNQIDFSNRLPRGRTYANKGLARNIQIHDNKITAEVQGSRPRPYKVSFTVPPFSNQEKAKITETWAVPCKHMASVIYLIANEIDQNPFLVFELHRFDLFEALKKAGYTSQESQDIRILSLARLWEKIITENYHQLIKGLGKRSTTDTPSTALDIQKDLIEDLEIILSEKGAFLDVSFRDKDGKVLFNFEKIDALIDWLEELSFSRIQQYAPGLRGKVGTKIKQPITADFFTALASIFLTYLVTKHAKVKDRLWPIEVVQLFFNQKAEPFNDYETKDYPVAIQLWLNKFYIIEKDFVPVIKVDDSEEGFAVEVAFEDKRKKTRNTSNDPTFWNKSSIAQSAKKDHQTSVVYASISRKRWCGKEKITGESRRIT